MSTDRDSFGVKPESRDCMLEQPLQGFNGVFSGGRIWVFWRQAVVDGYDYALRCLP
jgi:hypothetical protein